MDLEVDDNYVVEHGENFELSQDQFRKLIENKFSRSRQYAKQQKERESRLKHAD